jgi:hypothetical protein
MAEARPTSFDSAEGKLPAPSAERAPVVATPYLTGHTFLVAYQTVTSSDAGYCSG